MYRGGSSGGGGAVNNLNGSGGRRQVLSSVDFYRRVPKDLTEVRAMISGNRMNDWSNCN
jgi:hypothetical protein